MTVTDQTTLHKTNDPNAVTVRKVRDPSVVNTQVGTGLFATVQDASGNTSNWRKLFHSDNLNPYNPAFDANLFITFDAIPPSRAHETWDLGYAGLNDGSTSTGIARNLNEEIDRYLSQVTIHYKDDQNQTQQAVFYVPNSALATLRGWDKPTPDNPIQFVENYTINPASSNWVPFFENMQYLLHDQSTTKSLSRLKNRNTPVPVPDPNPAETLVSLLDAISTPDVHNHDDLPYPTGVEISMKDYSNGNTSTTMQDKYANHIKEKYGIEIVQPSEQLLAQLRNKDISPQEYQEIQKAQVDKAITNWYQNHFATKLYHAPKDIRLYPFGELHL